MQAALQFCCAYSAVLLRTTNDTRDVLSLFYGSQAEARLRSKPFHVPQFRRVRVQIIMMQYTFPNRTPQPNTYTTENLKQEKNGVDTHLYLTDKQFGSW